MTETFVYDLLQHELDTRRMRIESLDIRISILRNRSTRTTNKNKKDYILYKTELDKLERERRSLRGEISALRQAIKKLERSE